MAQVFSQTTVSDHAIKRCQQRGVNKVSLSRLLEYGDRHVPVGSSAIAISMSQEGAARLRRQGCPAAEIARLDGLAAVVCGDGAVVTVLHITDRRYRRSRR